MCQVFTISSATLISQAEQPAPPSQPQPQRHLSQTEAEAARKAATAQQTDESSTHRFEPVHRGGGAAPYGPPRAHTARFLPGASPRCEAELQSTARMLHLWHHAWLERNDHANRRGLTEFQPPY